MHQKTITFSDLEGNPVTQTFWFHMPFNELVRMEASEQGGMSKMLNQLTVERDGQKILDIFEAIILMSYGVKSEDGIRFIKSEEMRTAFKQTDAYDKLFLELALNTKAASDFVNDIVPKGALEEIEKLKKEGKLPQLPDGDSDDAPEKTFEQYSRGELMRMSQDQFDRLVGTDITKMSHSQLTIAMQRKNQS